METSWEHLSRIPVLHVWTVVFFYKNQISSWLNVEIRTLKVHLKQVLLLVLQEMYAAGLLWLGHLCVSVCCVCSMIIN